MFKEDIPDFHQLTDTPSIYYQSVPNDFWRHFLSLFQEQCYQRNEIKWIIHRCAELVHIHPSSGWRAEDISNDARQLIRKLHEYIHSGQIDILMDCLFLFIMPARLTVSQLNTFLHNHHIGYYYDEKYQKWSVSRMEEKKIFISHSSLDRQYVLAFADFLEDLGLSQEQIFCSSIPRYGIPLNHDIYDYLSEQFHNYDIHVIYMLSNHYYQSPACLNEMGASWILHKSYTTLLLPGFQYQKIQGAIDAGRISIKLDDDPAAYRLRELADNLIAIFHLPTLENYKLERHIKTFLEKINHYKDTQHTIV